MEMKRFVKTFAIILSALLLFSVVGCKKKPSGEGGGSTTPEIPAIPDTGIVLAENGASDYKIALKKDASAADRFSAEELQTYIRLSTGATLPIVEETDGANFGNKFLSVGRTALFDASGITATFDELGRDGFKIVSKDDAVYICGGMDSGTAFGVFEFLHDEVGYEAYAADAIYYEKHDKLFLKDFNKTDKPALPERYMDGTMHTKDVDSSYRYRFVNEIVSPAKYTTYGKDTWVGSAAHALHDLLPRKENIAAHPSWYPDNAQICLTNEEMFEAFIEELEKCIDENRKGYRISLGQEDGFTAWCPCEKCKAEWMTYGGTGYWIRFCNKVVERVEKDLKDPEKLNQPDREIQYAAFAYSITFNPPVNADGELIDESCRPHEKLGIRLCTGLQFCHYHKFDDPNCKANADAYAACLKWLDISDKITVWGYSANYNHYLPFYDNFGMMQREIQLYRDWGCQNLYMEYISGANMTSFDYLRCYLFGKLCWNPDIDLEKAIDDFMQHYYLDVGDDMKDIFVTYRDYMAKQDAAGIHTGATGGMAQNFQAWSRNFVDGMIAKVNAVLDKCKALEDRERGEMLYNRILGERVSIMYAKLLSYEEYGYPIHELESAINLFESDVDATGTRSHKEGKSVKDFILDMRKKVYA